MRCLTALLFCVKLQAQLSSTYTGLAEANCAKLKSDRETGAASRICSGVNGYKLIVSDEDSRMSISVVSPDHSRHQLQYWATVLPGFSHLGEKAEWRVEYKNGIAVPQALIVRVYSETGSKGSYLAIAKINQNEICVTGKVPAGKGDNERAREAADSAASKSCVAVPQEKK